MARLASYIAVFIFGLSVSFRSESTTNSDLLVLNKHIKAYSELCTKEKYGLEGHSVMDVCTGLSALIILRNEIKQGSLK